MLLIGLLAQAVGHAILVLSVSSVNNSVALILTGSYEEESSYPWLFCREEQRPLINLFSFSERDEKVVNNDIQPRGEIPTISLLPLKIILK